MTGIDASDLLRTTGHCGVGPVDDQVAFQNRPLERCITSKPGGEVEATLRGFAILCGVEPAVSELEIVNVPADACEVLEPGGPLLIGEGAPGRFTLDNLHSQPELAGRSP